MYFSYKLFAVTALAWFSFVVAKSLAYAAPVEPPLQAAKALHPWQAAMPILSADAYLTNLRDGDSIETPFLLKFGLSGGWGLAPISKAARSKSGHHHLLINRELPLDFKQALPFNEQYRHFGNGQMETVLTLAPGTYTLRMLLADDKHIPHFVYSKPITVVVTKKTDVDPKSLIKSGIAINVAERELKSPFRVQFHASGLNVAHLAQQEKGTGHFKLHMIPKSGSKAAEIDFTEGQTEVWLAPPAGDYTLRLEFLDNLDPGKALAAAVSVPVKVQ